MFYRAVTWWPVRRHPDNIFLFSYLILVLHTMEDLPPNRLRCRDCRQYRLIAEFPFDDRGYRLTCCTLCQARQVRQRAYKSKKQEMPENSTASTSSTGSTKVCTHCFVKCNLSLFGKFATCNLCQVILFALY
jgi:hypothetical protein